MTSDERDQNPWPAIIGPCFTDESFCRELQVTKAWLSTAVQELQVLQIVTADWINVYPSFQVHEGRVVPGLEVVLRELANGSYSALMWAQWLNRPAKRPDGARRRRIDELAAGHIDALAEEARHSAAAWSDEGVIRPAQVDKIDTVLSLYVKTWDPKRGGEES